jgi:methyltransferase-like protein
MLGMLRQMMLYHTRHISDPHQKAAAARQLLDFLAKSITTGSDTHGSFLYVYVNYIKEYFLPKSDAFLLHDELAEINTPVYFYEFADQAARHGLQYVGDVQFSTMLASNLAAEVAATLREMVKNTIELEQYLDFLRNRMFRQSLLCAKEVKLNPRLKPERLAQFYIASSALTEAHQVDIHSTSPEKFVTPDGATLTTDHPVTKAAMQYLVEIWPQSVSFMDLLSEARQRIGGESKLEDAHLLGMNLLKAYGYSENLVEFHLYRPKFVTEVTDYPLASPVARYQAQHGQSITNMRHERITLDELSAQLLTYLDGSRDRSTLCAALAALDKMEIQHRDGAVVEDAAEIKVALTEVLAKKLDQFAQAALLVG